MPVVNLLHNIDKSPAETLDTFTYLGDKDFVLGDLDGTMCEFRQAGQFYVDIHGGSKFWHFEDMYERGYFYNLAPHTNMVEAFRHLITTRKDKEFGILSAVLSDAPYALEDKIAWVKKYIPEMKEENMIFVACGTDKGAQIVNPNARVILVDDYTHNLNNFTSVDACRTGQKVGIKVYNGINNTYGSWRGPVVDLRLTQASWVEKSLMKIIDGPDFAKDNIQPIGR